MEDTERIINKLDGHTEMMTKMSNEITLTSASLRNQKEDIDTLFDRDREKTKSIHEIEKSNIEYDTKLKTVARAFICASGVITLIYGAINLWIGIA